MLLGSNRKSSVHKVSLMKLMVIASLAESPCLYGDKTSYNKYPATCCAMGSESINFLVRH